MLGITHTILQIRQHRRTAGAPILIGAGFRNGVVHGEVIGHVEGVAAGPDLHKGIAVNPIHRKTVERGAWYKAFRCPRGNRCFPAYLQLYRRARRPH